MRTRFSLLLILGLLATGLVAGSGTTVGAADAPRGGEIFFDYFPSEDGTELRAEYVLPVGGCDDVVNTDGTTGCPTIVSVGPYFGSGQQGSPLHTGIADRFFDYTAYEFDTDDDGVGDSTIFEMGYAWVQVDSRGYGGSSGCNDYGGSGEQMDAAAAVDWAGSQPWSNGKVGMWGKSYDAWTQVMALAENPVHLEAVVIQAPLIERYGIAFVNGVHHSATWFVTTAALYPEYDYGPNSLNDDPRSHVNNTTGIAGYNPHNNGIDTPACWGQQNVESLNPDHDWYFWQEGHLQPRASRNDDVAVFWTHGFTDVNTKPDQVFGVYDGLTEGNGDKTRAWFGQWDHVRGSDVQGHLGGNLPQGTGQHVNEDFVVGRAGWHEETLDWLNHYLRGEDFKYEVNEQNLVEVQDQLGQWRTERTYPSTDVRMVDMPIAPGSYTDEMSSDGYWTLSQPVTEEFRITGESTVTIDVTTEVPFAQFVGVLYDVDGDRAEEISRTAFRIPQSGTGTYSFQTHPGDWLLQKDHQLGFKIMSNHAQFQPYPTNTEVTVNGGTVSMPIPQFEREINLTGGDTTSRSAYNARIDAPTVVLTADQFDIDALGAVPYHGNPADHPQGDLDASRPVD